MQSGESGISRREFLFGSLPKIALGSLGVFLGISALDNKENIVKKIAEKHVVDVKAEGVDIHCIFNVHGNEALGIEAVPVTKEDLGSYKTTLIETGASEYLNDDFQLTQRLADPNDSLSQLYPLVVQGLDEGGNSLILADIPVRMTNMAVDAAVAVSAGVLGEKARRMTRREWLRNALIGVMGWGIGGSAAVRNALPTVQNFLPKETYDSMRTINAFLDLSHPESVYKSFREAILAAKTFDLGSDPKNVIFGTGHWTLPFYLESGKKAVYNFLSKYPRPLIDAFIPDRRYLYTSVIAFKNDRGEYVKKEIVHEELKQLFQ